MWTTSNSTCSNLQQSPKTLQQPATNSTKKSNAKRVTACEVAHVGSGAPAVHCHTTRGSRQRGSSFSTLPHCREQWAVGLLQCTAGGRGQSVVFSTPPHCRGHGAVGLWCGVVWCGVFCYTSWPRLYSVLRRAMTRHPKNVNTNHLAQHHHGCV
jgi:hypothetical protein